ncbi:MAG: TPM domain-containing protein [Candidatus Sumerlaeia bacterium]|nr:TPM domain-containing protein [Candidatus Sumerlaeia bacterium]
MRLFSIALALVFALLAGAAGGQIPIPPAPEDGAFVNDYAGLIHGPELDRMGAAQRTAFETHATPIVVVTVPSMKAYGFTGTIEEFARRWFNQWGIGTLNDPSGARANRGMLLLVSVGDRKARIELGADWGRGADGYCQSVMAASIIPAFKRGDYSGGIAAGVEALAKLAADPPESSGAPVNYLPPGGAATPPPPQQFIARHQESSGGAGGLQGCFGGLLALVALVARALGFKTRRGSTYSAGSSGGGYRSRGGFSGGRSGGGGATGSW